MKKKEIFLKIMLIVSFIAMLNSIVFLFLRELDMKYHYYAVVFFVLFIVLGGFTVMLMCFIRITPHETKALRYKSRYGEYNDIISFFRKRLSDLEYQELEIQDNYFRQFSTLWVSHKWNKTVCILVSYQKELEDYFIDEYGEAFFNAVYNSYPNAKAKDIELINLVCVDRVNATFQKYVNQNTPEIFGRYQFLSGLSFGSRTLYIAQKKGGAFKSKYNNLKNYFCTLMGLSELELVSKQ